MKRVTLVLVLLLAPCAALAQLALPLVIPSVPNREVRATFDTTWDAVTTAAGNEWTVTTASTGSTGVPDPIPDPQNRVGVLSVSFGANAAARWFVNPSGIGNGFLLGNGRARWWARFQINTLSDGTNTYTIRHGWRHTGSGEPIDGVYFRYTHGTNDGEWEGVCRSNNTETAVDLNVDATAAEDCRFLVDVEADASGADFYIVCEPIASVTAALPVFRGSCASNVPAASASRRIGYGLEVLRSAGTGTMSHVIEVDYVRARIDLAVKR